MKNLLLLLAFLIGAVAVNAQTEAHDEFFQKYQDTEHFTVISISPKMFQMFATVLEETEDQEEIAEIAKEIEGLRILTTETTPLKYYEEAINTLNTSSYESLMTVRDEGENVRFFVKENGNKISALLLLVGGKDEFVYLSFFGDLDLEKIAKLAKKMEIDGMEHLENVDKMKKKAK